MIIPTPFIVVKNPKPLVFTPKDSSANGYNRTFAEPAASIVNEKRIRVKIMGFVFKHILNPSFHSLKISNFSSIILDFISMSPIQKAEKKKEKPSMRNAVFTPNRAIVNPAIEGPTRVDAYCVVCERELAVIRSFSSTMLGIVEALAG